ncbi:single-strand binding protein [Arthrobacter alpinus]|uniref:Single-stranded DNA-binding protein n=1 Tax=Arthrobacter alpinus TaxID=656366 RepID=A0A1H5M2P0_9MICC|nr:single-stranded DNA-binding protein [Arthrobacter alpinus]SEE83554.1 single-strand binding protein [Arthrobacter alpinus]
MAQIATTANIGTYYGLKFGQDGKARISFSAAETARIKDQSGNWTDGGTTWFNVTLFGGASEALDLQITANQGKGRVTFAGRMNTRDYEKDGQQRQSLDVVADFVGLVPKNPQQQNGQLAQQNNQGGYQQQQQPGQQSQQQGFGGGQQQQNSGGWGNGQTSEAPF